MTVINGTTGIDKVQDGTIGFVDMIGTEWANSKAANGYQKLPSGLILQWGTYTSATGNATITFPIAFPTFCINIFDIIGPNAGLNAGAEIVVSKSTSNAVVFTNGSGTFPHMWFALGY